ncbi:hypothetical protein XELAEV_18032571mg [Xenopus laevis]|uniref:Uncharacterized protein n=1 Tax=Xenopus laevis TaxID=8355 RepID=A0A974CRM8_XENLA|nr:hypothetical protein XELAEV_18032571mg [Xenopus laevis]
MATAIMLVSAIVRGPEGRRGMAWAHERQIDCGALGMGSHGFSTHSMGNTAVQHRSGTRGHKRRLRGRHTAPSCLQTDRPPGSLFVSLRRL